jgi:hypothetical protein
MSEDPSDPNYQSCPPAGPQDVLAVRVGHGANCSSVGSVIDTLFATAAVGSALFAAVLAALAREPITTVGEGDEVSPSKEPAP